MHMEDVVSIFYSRHLTAICFQKSHVGGGGGGCIYYRGGPRCWGSSLLSLRTYLFVWQCSNPQYPRGEIVGSLMISTAPIPGNRGKESNDLCIPHPTCTPFWVKIILCNVFVSRGGEITRVLWCGRGAILNCACDFVLIGGYPFFCSVVRVDVYPCFDVGFWWFPLKKILQMHTF